MAYRKLFPFILAIIVFSGCSEKTVSKKYLGKWEHYNFVPAMEHAHSPIFGTAVKDSFMIWHNDTIWYAHLSDQ